MNRTHVTRHSAPTVNLLLLLVCGRGAGAGSSWLW